MQRTGSLAGRRVLAGSLQAKGRAERAKPTPQDRPCEVDAAARDLRAWRRATLCRRSWGTTTGVSAWHRANPMDAHLDVLHDGWELPVRLLGEGEDPSPVEDGKSGRQRADRAKAEQRSRLAWKPPPDSGVGRSAGGGRGGRRLKAVPSHRDRRRVSTEDHSPEGDISRLKKTEHLYCFDARLPARARRP